MKDKFISAVEIKEELKEIESQGMNLARNLSLLAQKIKYLLEKIKACEALYSAQEYFDLLDDIQSVLAGLVFKEEIGIPDRLRKFVTDFDNLEHVKEAIFSEIKSGEYRF